jgi:uncharacterized cupredoxin-like copper-binding protein
VKSILIAATLVALVTAACGSDGGDKRAEAAPARTVDVDMVDTAFQPAALTAEPGERIRFVFHNRGQAVHDAFIGDAAAQAEHEQEMRESENGDHGGGHGSGDDDQNALTLDPGKQGELIYTFDGTGTLEIGCHQPGHYAAGMKTAVTVT